MMLHRRPRTAPSRLALGLSLAFGLLSGGVAEARTILFVGNSFTFGALSPVRRFHPERVNDLNREGIGGVPALFATFADEARLDWQVSLETSPGKDLAFHLQTKRQMLARPWDVVLLQGYSLLDPQRPGDPARHVAAAKALAALARAANRNAEVDLVSTWSRADQVYRPGGPWSGRPVERMSQDLAAANAAALEASSDLKAAIPVGAAWIRAMHEGVADPDPYDGTSFGQVDLWSYDHYHASTAGYYLEALVIFGSVTGVDPRRLGPHETAADDLGMDPQLASALQRIASETLAAAPARTAAAHAG